MPVAQVTGYPDPPVFTDPREKRIDEYVVGFLDKFYERGWAVDYRHFDAYDGRCHAIMDYKEGPGEVTDEYAGDINALAREWGYNTHITRKEHNRIYEMLAKCKELTNIEHRGQIITLYRHQSISNPYDYSYVITLLEGDDAMRMCKHEKDFSE
jgi:hypothetical protein